MKIVRPQFVPFDERRAVRIYHRNLPHWRQDGATYFVTFREGDSIPEPIAQQWEYEKRLWLTARGVSYDGQKHRSREGFAKLSSADQSRFYKHFNHQVQSCLDRGLGACFLRNRACIEAVRNKLLANDGGQYHLGDFVIMPNHVHVLITPAPGLELELILKRIKGATAIECNRSVGRSGTFWQADSYDHIVRSLEQLHAFRQYISNNPANAGFATPSAARYVAPWMDEWFKM